MDICVFQTKTLQDCWSSVIYTLNYWLQKVIEKNVSLCKESYQTVCRMTKEFLTSPKFKSFNHLEKSGQPVTVNTNVLNVRET